MKEVRITLERVASAESSEAESEANTEAEASSNSANKLTTSKLAQKQGVKTAELLERFIANGYLELRDGKHYITAKGKDAGGEFRMSPKFGPYFLWPEGLGA